MKASEFEKALEKTYHEYVTHRSESLEDNPYNGVAQELFDKYNKDYAEICLMATKSGFPQPISPLLTNKLK